MLLRGRVLRRVLKRGSYKLQKVLRRRQKHTLLGEQCLCVYPVGTERSKTPFPTVPRCKQHTRALPAGTDGFAGSGWAPPQCHVACRLGDEGCLLSS